MSTLTLETTTLLSSFGVHAQHLAHTPNESLFQHASLSKHYYHKLLNVKGLSTVIKKLINTIDKENATLIEEMFENAVVLHDVGKINPAFQAVKMKNVHFQNHEDSSDTSHAKQGAQRYLEYYKQKIDAFEEEAFFRLTYILYSFAFCIQKHHGRLEDFETYCAKTQKDIEQTHVGFNNAKTCIDECLENPFELFILSKLLFSLLISSDYYATTEYMAFKNQKTFEYFGVLNKEEKEVLKKCFNTYKHSLGKASGINLLREEMSQEALTNLLAHQEKNIFYLEAPTGSGKTLTSMNLALNLFLENDALNKLFYIFPFNTLVEQTKQVFDEVFAKKLHVEVINSVTPITPIQNQEERETDYESSYVNRLFFHAPAVLTTHVNFFNILFGTSKEENFPLWQLANSVVILDEIQSYNNHLWWYMVDFFEHYARVLNIKIIIMSATLPKLDYFLERKESFVNLIKASKRDSFFQNAFFKERVEIQTLHLEEKTSLEELYVCLCKEHQNYKKILFEFISKKRAREFYELIKDDFEHVYELSGDDNKASRQYVIEQTKSKECMIVVATQVIEAGVDIDMDLGFKDISTLDSEEQFMGRINRSCKKNALNPKVIFFDLDETKNIYKNDNRLGYDLKDEYFYNLLVEKNFEAYYDFVLKAIKRDKLRFKEGLLTDYKHFEKDVLLLNYKSLAKTMTLIKSETFTLYFPFCIDITKHKDLAEFQNLESTFLTEGMLDGQKVWQAYLELNDIDSFTQKEVLKSKIKSLMQFFTFNIFKHYEAQRPFIGELIAGYYYESNLEFITEDNKFDREKYNQLKNSNFL